MMPSTPPIDDSKQSNGKDRLDPLQLSMAAGSTDLVGTDDSKAGKPDNLHHIWWQLAILVAISAVAVYACSSFDEELDKILPESRLVASTYNKKPSGLKALYELTRMISLNARAWEYPYRQLPRNTNDLFVIISPSESLRDFELDKVLNWVKRGNELIYFDDFGYEMSKRILAKLKVKLKKVNNLEKPEAGDVAPAGAIDELKKVKSLHLGSQVRLIGDERSKAVAGDQYGSLILLIKHGKGRIWLGSVPDFLNNRSISKKDCWGNFQFAANIFRTISGTIYFDERAHGFSGGTNVFVYLSRGPLGFCSAQILLILIIAVLSETRRFGAARFVDRRRKISNLEFINGLSNAYRRARANPAVLEILFRSFFNRLCRSLAVSPHEPKERLVEAWAQSPYHDRFDLSSLFKQYEDNMTRRDVSDSDLKTMVASCDKIIGFTLEPESAQKIKPGSEKTN